MSGSQTLEWKFGLRGNNGKYFSVETFGDQLSVTGTSMRKKQIFTLEQADGASFVNIKTPTNKYLSGAAKGQLTCTTEKGKDEEWTIVPQKDGTWALKSAHGNYLSGGDSGINADGRDIGANEKWVFHLAMHPQVALRNSSRKAYAHFEGDAINVNEQTPWGHDALITMEFHDGRYSLMTSNGKYLEPSGKLVDSVTEDAKFIVEFFDAQVAFKDKDGNYLTPNGPKGQLVAKRNQVGKNELFALEDSQPQVTFVASNGKIGSIKQTEDVKASHSQDDELTDSEIWQMEINKDNGKWYFRNNKGKYWVVSSNIISCSGSAKSDDGLFTINYYDDKVTLKAPNGKFVGIKPNGAFHATFDSEEDNTKFHLNIINRPQCVLRCEYGFVNSRTKSISCNSSSPEAFILECDNGKYAFKTKGGKYFSVQGDGTITASSDSKEYFYFELLVHTKFAIKSAKNNKYIKGEHQGNFKASLDAPEKKDDLWEY